MKHLLTISFYNFTILSLIAHPTVFERTYEELGSVKMAQDHISTTDGGFAFVGFTYCFYSDYPYFVKADGDGVIPAPSSKSNDLKLFLNPVTTEAVFEMPIITPSFHFLNASRQMVRSFEASSIKPILDCIEFTPGTF